MNVVQKQERKNAIGNFAMSSFWAISTLFVNTFLVAQIFILSNQNITLTAGFMLVKYTLLFAFNVITSILMAKGVSAIWISRVSAIGAFVFIIVISAMPDILITHTILLGAAWGIISGLYWGPSTYLVVKIYKREHTKTFFTIKQLTILGIQVIFPFTFGALIDFGSMVITSILVGIIVALQLLTSFMIKIDQGDKRKLQMLGFFRAAKKKKFLKPIISYNGLTVLSGINSTIALAIVMVIILSMGTHFSLGAITSIISVVGMIIVASYKLIKEKRLRIAIFMVAAIIPFLGSLSLMISFGAISIIIFNFASAFKRIMFLEKNTETHNLPKYWGDQEFILESNLLIKFAIYVGRAITFGLLILVGTFSNPEYWLIILINLMLFAFAFQAMWFYEWKLKYKPKHDQQVGNTTITSTT
ncbi:MAG: hypothetical protein FWE01_01630 [Firmicutes bacterium]|nr:hypothetical protein [Bacillota bacterium]